MSKTIGSKEYNEWLNSPLTKALKRSFEQSITDPENQPSQYGTVTLEYMQKEIETMIQKAGEVMRERCAKGAEKEAVQIVVDGREERAYNNAVSDCAEAIRALPGVTVEHLK